MTHRRRTILLLGTACALAPAASAAAIVLPTTPPLAPAPEFANGPTIGPGWSPAVFSSGAIEKGYVLQVTDVTTGGIEFTQVAAPATSTTVGDRQNGHTYRLRIRAREVRCTVAMVGDVCPSTSVHLSAWSGWVETRTDTSAPAGTLSINGGATYTTTRSVTLGLSASDPSSSGVGGVQISTDGVFNCLLSPDAAECPVEMAASRPATLPDGPDGPRDVWVTYRDRSRAYFPPGTLISAYGNLGNPSPPAHDTIVLDRSRPTTVVTMGVPTADAGVPVAFSAATSTDATSGVDTGSAVWDFGDGTAPVHALQLNKSFAAPGTYDGSLTIADKAGNTNTQAFSFTVTGAPSATGGGVQVTDPGVTEPVGGTPQTTPGGATVPGGTVDDPIRGARRLGRAVQGKTLRIRVRVATRIPVRVTILRVTGAGTSVVRRATKTGGPGFMVFTFRAPKAGRHVVRVTAGSDRLTFPMAIARR